MRLFKQKTFLIIAVVLLTGTILFTHSVTRVRADNFYSLQNTPHACSTQAECDALNAGGPDSTGKLNSQNAPTASSPGQSDTQSSSNNNSSGASQNCWHSEQEMIDATPNMANFDWQMCPDATDNTNQNTSSPTTPSLSDFDNGLPSVDDQNLSQFDNTTSNSNPLNQFDSQGNNYVPIKVPLLNQNDPANGTLGSVACGPTSLAMIASYYGIDISTAQVIQDTNVNSSGTNLSTLANVAKQIGLTDTTSNSGIISGLYDAFTGGSAAYSGVSQAVSNGNPVIVNVDESPYSNGHAMVVTGISGDDVYVNNPWTGQSQVYGKTQFMAMWGSEGYGYIVPKP